MLNFCPICKTRKALRERRPQPRLHIPQCQYYRNFQSDPESRIPHIRGLFRNHSGGVFTAPQRVLFMVVQHTRSQVDSKLHFPECIARSLLPDSDGRHPIRERPGQFDCRPFSRWRFDLFRIWLSTIWLMSTIWLSTFWLSTIWRVGNLTVDDLTCIDVLTVDHLAVDDLTYVDNLTFDDLTYVE